MINSIKRFFADKRGVATLEMGLAFPLFIAAMIPPIEYARYVYTKRILTVSVDQGVRYASLTLADENSGVTEDDVRDLIIQKARGQALTREDITISYDPTAVSGSRVTVSASLEFREMTNVMGDLFVDVEAVHTLF